MHGQSNIGEAPAVLRCMPLAAQLLVSVFAAALFQPPVQPLATFSGRVHGVSRKQITVETPEGNLVDFLLSRKTRVKRAGKDAKPQDLKSGDTVTIEAKHEIDGALTALAITAEPGG